jgi:hypothetical protein
MTRDCCGDTGGAERYVRRYGCGEGLDVDSDTSLHVVALSPKVEASEPEPPSPPRNTPSSGPSSSSDEQARLFLEHVVQVTNNKGFRSAADKFKKEASLVDW